MGRGGEQDQDQDDKAEGGKEEVNLIINVTEPQQDEVNNQVTSPVISNFFSPNIRRVFET